VDVCQYPSDVSQLPMPVTDGPFFHMGKALALRAWNTPEEQRKLANLSASTAISWVHVAATEKLMAPVDGYTIEVISVDVYSFPFLNFDLCVKHLQAWFRPRSGWISKAYLISSEKVSLSYYLFDVTGCGGILLELGKDVCLSLPANHIYSTCHCGPKILEAEVK
jgi:hypothetical protein